jgi:hypothetical protein
MRPSQSPPEGYAPAGGVVLAGNSRLANRLNLLSLPWFVVCGAANFALFGLVYQGRTEMTVDLREASTTTLIMALLFIVAALVFVAVVIVLAVILHEAAHGVVYWALTKRRPVFGFKGWYFYAAAPGWYFSRGQFLAAGLAPLVLVPLLALPVLAFAPALVALVATIGLTVNATGALGDLYLVARLLRQPRHVVVEDLPEGIAWYLPG